MSSEKEEMEGRLEDVSAKNSRLNEVLTIQSTPKEEQTALMKTDLVLIPLMGFAYFLQFLDRFILGQATFFNLREDLNLRGSQYSWTSAIFYFGSFVWTWPASYLLVRLPIAKYLSITVFLWGGVLMCHAACENIAGLMVVRFLLGVGEAAMGPGCALITGMFYTRQEQPLRQSAWALGNCISSLLAGLISYGIGGISTTDIPRWKLLFLITGAVTSAYAFILIRWLPDSPLKAKFLTPKERNIVLQRTMKNKTGVMDSDSFRWDHARAAVVDPQTWFLVLNCLAANVANGGLITFVPILMTGFGFPLKQSLLLQMSLGGCQIILLVSSSLVATFVPSTRLLCMIFNTFVSLAGMTMIWKIDLNQPVARMAGLAMGVAYSVNIPLSLSIITSNVAGFSKKSVVSGLLFVAYCVGNIVGPQLFLSSEAPSYPKPTITSEEDWKDVQEMAAKQDGAWGPPVFSHGDLSPANVLVRGDNVVGIIDWEFSGWYPEYWEYTSAWSFQGIETEWQDILVHSF